LNSQKNPNFLNLHKKCFAILISGQTKQIRIGSNFQTFLTAKLWLMIFLSNGLNCTYDLYLHKKCFAILISGQTKQN